jgi:hypothetical protein
VSDNSTKQISSKSQTSSLQNKTSSTPRVVENNIVYNSPCPGTPIPVSYSYDKAYTAPFECGPYCNNRKSDPHYILYTNGFGAQCGIETCTDWGEDHCTPCLVPDEVLAQYGFSKPEGDPPCKKKVTSSAAASSSGFSSSIRTTQPAPVPWTPPAE